MLGRVLNFSSRNECENVLVICNEVIIDRAIEQGSTNPLIFLSVTNEQSRPMNGKIFVFVYVPISNFEPVDNFAQTLV
jgi:hypothetical protein